MYWYYVLPVENSFLSSAIVKPIRTESSGIYLEKCPIA